MFNVSPSTAGDYVRALISPFPRYRERERETKLAPAEAVRIAVSYSLDVSVDIAIVKHRNRRIMQEPAGFADGPRGNFPTRSKFSRAGH